LWSLRERIAPELENFRREKHHTYEAHVRLPVSAEEVELSKVFGNELPELLLVGAVEFVGSDQSVAITAVSQAACPRCWRPDPLEEDGLCKRCSVAVES